MHRTFLTFAMLAVLAACSTREIETAPVPIGDFTLGFLVPVTSPNLTRGPLSREASPEEWKAAVDAAFRPRFASLEGGKFYHLGVVVEGYVLARPALSLATAPKSALIFSVTVIRDADEMTLTPEPQQFTVQEEFAASTLVGSGLVLSKEKQMANLAQSAADQVENWLRDQPWFYEPEAPFDAAGFNADAEG